MKTLGVETAPDCNSEWEFQRMLALMEGWRENIRTSHLRKTDAWQALNTTIWKSLTLSEEKCHKIMASALLAGLTNSHICRNFPRSLVNASTSNPGAGIPNLFTTQGINHLELMMSAGTSTSLTGQLLRASFEAFLTGCGLGRNICAPQWKLVM
jgi:hypothetical protein